MSKKYKRVPWGLELAKKIISCEVDGHVGVKIETQPNGHEKLVKYIEVAEDQ